MYITIFEQISKPFNEGEGKKEQEILSLLSCVNGRYEPHIGIIVPAMSQTRVVVVSHIDLIPKFNKGFGEGKTFELYTSKKGYEKIKGALDNTLTNAILIEAILALRAKGLCHDIEFVFTEGEEEGMHGMDNYIQKYGTKPFFINLDVTNEFYGEHDISVEYDYPNRSIYEQLKALPFSIGFTTYRVADDTDMVLGHGGRGLSFCLPTKGTIHSYKNSAKLISCNHYLEALKDMLCHLDVSTTACDMEDFYDDELEE